MEFREIKIEHKEILESYTFNTNFGTCELAFTNLFTLKQKYGTQIFADDFLYIRQVTKSTPNAFHYFMPIGNGDLSKAVERIEDDARSHGKGFIFWGITEEMKGLIEEVMPGRFEFTTDRGWAEYIYQSKRLITLEGSDLKKRRNNLNLFLNKYGTRYSFEPLTENNLEEAWEFQQKWLEDNSDKNPETSSLETENEIVRRVFDNWNRLGLKGGMVKIDGKVLGYTYGAPSYTNMFDIFVEKADHNYNGIYQAINRDFAVYACSDYEFINREEDLGIEGLRRSKLAYKPEKLLTKYMGVYK